MLTLRVVNSKKYKEEESIALGLFHEIPPKLRKLWGIESRGNIQMYLNKSQTLFMLRTLPIHKALLLILTFPLWYAKSKQNTKPSRIMTRERSGKYFVFLSPINLNKTEKSPTEEQIFYEMDSPGSAFQRNVSHILVDVSISPMMLPHWLKNGFTIFCGNLILGNKVFKNGSLRVLNDVVHKEIVKYSLTNDTEDEFIYNNIKGYWTVRYLEEEYPGFLKETFKNYKGEEVVRKIVEKLDLDTTDDEKMWGQLDELLYNHYEHLLETE